jgi:hypothetical protein
MSRRPKHRQLGAFESLIRRRLAQAHAAFPDLTLTVSLTLGDPAEFPAERNYAYSAWDGNKAQIVFAPKRLDADEAQQDALLRHELAHAILQHAGLDHSERDCDAVAERIFGAPIYYDARDVQTLNPDVFGAQRPRPAHLPK